MPGWLQAVADWNPVSAVTAGVRDLSGHTEPFRYHPRLADAASGRSSPPLVGSDPGHRHPVGFALLRAAHHGMNKSQSGFIQFRAQGAVNVTDIDVRPRARAQGAASPSRAPPAVRQATAVATPSVRDTGFGVADGDSDPHGAPHLPMRGSRKAIPGPPGTIPGPASARPAHRGCRGCARTGRPPRQAGAAPRGGGERRPHSRCRRPPPAPDRASTPRAARMGRTPSANQYASSRYGFRTG